MLWNSCGERQEEGHETFPQQPIIPLDALIFFLYEASSIFPVVSAISLSNAEFILALPLHLTNINWLFLSSLYSDSFSLFSFPLFFHFLPSNKGV